MISLTPLEARALGVLIEKATTTPEQYPLSLNALTNGCNQKNNRSPVMSISEDEAFEAVEGLRSKQLVVRVDQVGSRVHKYKHTAGETLHCKAGELAVLAELLLRGPQTLGELRGRANRMHPLATLDDVKTMLRGLMEQENPLVRELPPAPGTRAENYMQLLAADAHPLPASQPVAAAPASVTTPSPSAMGLGERITALESEVASLREALRKLATAVGEPDPLQSESV